MIASARIPILVLALALAAPALGQGVTSRTVALGQSAPLSGPHRQLGEDLRNGALAYLRRLNEAGGVHGRRIELATLDDAGDPAKALANARRLIEEFRVFALFGFPEASVSRELLTLVHQARVPLLAPETGAQVARQPGRAVFAMRASHADEIEGVVAHFARLGLKRFALVRQDDAAGAEYLAGARSALERRGLDAPADARIGNGVAGAANEAFMTDPDVVIAALPEPPAADLARSLKHSGRRAQIVVLSTADPVQLARSLGAEGAGVVVSQVVPPLGRVALPLVADFHDDFKAETGRAPESARALEAYIGIKVLTEAVRRAGLGLTRDAFLQSLQAMSSFDAGGYDVSFSRTVRQASDRVYLMTIARDGSLLH